MACILLVDDDPDLLHLYQLFLRKKGHDVLLSHDGSAALEQLSSVGYSCDLIISDVQMPGMDGVELCRHVRAHPLGGEVPILLLSAMDDERVICAGLEAGASDFLPKPSSNDMIAAKVRHFLRRRGSDQLFGGYRLLRRLGAGGLGEVFSAERLSDGCAVAIKLMHPEIERQDEHQRRYEREVELLSSLQIPHLASILDSGIHRGRRFLVTELAPGRSVQQLLKERGTISLLEALQVGRQVSAAIAELSERGLAHRDVKPANILIDQRAEVTLIDYDLVTSREGPPLTEVGVVVGTPVYMAPEVVLGLERGDPAGDLYSLGVTLYEALTGHRPVEGEDLREILTGVARLAEPCRLSERRPDLSPAVADLIESLTQPKPQRRLCDPRAAEVAFQSLLQRTSRPTAKL